jgi:predicted ArsR family transcriptional regulator
MLAMDELSRAGVSAVAALEEPTRRRLYEFVVRQPDPVSRDEAGAALELPRATAAFHLERLAEEGLLDVVYERRTGRTGPGSGRPSKLYRRSSRSVAVSLPGRRYDLAGHLLAAALEDAERSGAAPRSALDRRSYDVGKDLGETARAAGATDEHDTVLGVLEEYGFEPRADGDEITLRNCPFHALARQHTELVCGMNLQLLDGLLDGLAVTGLRARLDPAPDRCCVCLEPARELSS